MYEFTINEYDYNDFKYNGFNISVKYYYDEYDIKIYTLYVDDKFITHERYDITQAVEDLKAML